MARGKEKVKVKEEKEREKEGEGVLANSLKVVKDDFAFFLTRRPTSG